MSLIDQAREELKRINFDTTETAIMIRILELFFDTWDSGGAVSAAAPILMRLLAGKPLSPLTGEDDEWVEVGDGVFQNKRASSVFKDKRFHDGQKAYDLDNPLGEREPIAFPYYQEYVDIPPPIIVFEQSTSRRDGGLKADEDTI